MTARATVTHVEGRTIHADLTDAPATEAIVTVRPWWRGGGIKVTLAGHSTRGWVTESFTGYEGRKPPPPWFRDALADMLAAFAARGQS